MTPSATAVTALTRIVRSMLFTIRSLPSSPDNAKRFQATEEVAGDVGRPVVRSQVDLGQPPRQRLQRDANLRPGQVVTGTLVDAVAERQVFPHVGAIRVDRVRIGELALVPVARSEQQQQRR